MRNNNNTKHNFYNLIILMKVNPIPNNPWKVKWIACLMASKFEFKLKGKKQRLKIFYKIIYFVIINIFINLSI